MTAAVFQQWVRWMGDHNIAPEVIAEIQAMHRGEQMMRWLEDRGLNPNMIAGER
jgi:hypothetical protein